MLAPTLPSAIAAVATQIFAGLSGTDVASPSHVIYSRDRWDGLHRRPHHLALELSKSGAVLFVERPIFLDDASAASLRLHTVRRNIIRATPILKSSPGVRDASAVSKVVGDLIVSELGEGGRLKGFTPGTEQWVYDPFLARTLTAVPFTGAVVYEAMDDSSLLDPSFERNERFLLGRANVVFASSPGIRSRVAALHPRVYFVAGGVDASLFALAMSPGLTVPVDAWLDGPVIGFVGNIDQRVDMMLIHDLAVAVPKATILMIGPSLMDPVMPGNVRFLGLKPYDELPRYLKSFDVAIMPFASGELSRHLLPASALECMAAGLPIVSTDVGDIGRCYGQVVQVTSNEQAFIGATMAALSSPDTERIDRGMEMAARSRWSHSVARMRVLLEGSVNPQPQGRTAPLEAGQTVRA